MMVMINAYVDGIITLILSQRTLPAIINLLEYANTGKSVIVMSLGGLDSS